MNMEEFENKLALLIKNVLTDEYGKPYSWFSTHSYGPQYKVDLENKKISFPKYLGPSLDISGITHELGHLMISSQEGLLYKSWGLENPYIIPAAYLNCGFDTIKRTNDLTEIRTEAKAWAWEYLIEVMAGIVDPKDPIRKHPEAEHLDDAYLMSKEEVEKTTETIFNQELQKILLTDWKERIRNVMGSVEHVLGFLKHNKYDYELDSREKVIKEKIFYKNDEQELSAKILDIGQEYYRVVAEFKIENDFIKENFAKAFYPTRNFKRAESFFKVLDKNFTFYAESMQQADPEYDQSPS